MRVIPTICLSLGLIACQANNSTQTSGNTAADINMALKQIDETGFMKHVNVLASDEFEGRAPSTVGGKKTVAYLEQEFKKLGLDAPFTVDGKASYSQPVDLMELTVTNNPALTIGYTNTEAAADELAYGPTSISGTSRNTAISASKDSQLVYVGYGVVAPEYGWNDYAGVDMKGKTALILVNDPGFRSEDDSLFKGNTMTYYGRWSYKYEEAARQGASGAIIIHEDKAAGYPWEVVSGSWSGAQYMLFTEDGNLGNVAVESWITKGAAERLFSKLNMNYADVVAKAGVQGFKPMPLEATASATLNIEQRRSTSYNVGGLLKGRERPDELFIYTAHWDHIGIKPGPEGEDNIYNGAQDNATGTAALFEMAEAYKELPHAPERSVLFLSVTAEESGLLGSKQYADDPAFPMNKTVAGINIDAMTTIGETDDIVVVGYGNSEMDDYLRTVSKAQGRTVIPENSPEKGYFYRSDHFNLAKKGVPMLYAESGETARGKPAGWGKAEIEKYTTERYHKPTDEVHEGWDNGGIMQDMEAQFRIGVAISDSNDWPKWTEGTEFKAIRESSLKQ